MAALDKTFSCRNRHRTMCLSHYDHKATVLTEQSLSVSTLARMTRVNQQNDDNSRNDATCTCLSANKASVLLSVQETTDIILLSYTLSISCRSNYVWDFTTKVQGIPVMKEIDNMTVNSLCFTRTLQQNKIIK